MLKYKFGLKHLQIIWTGHGAGDRAVAVHPNIRWVDLALLYGKKQRDRLLSLGHIRDGHYAIIGYIKFDAIPSSGKMGERYFRSDR